MYTSLVTTCTEEQGSKAAWADWLLRLHPGATVFVYIEGKWDLRTSVALRRAGFERRDTFILNAGNSFPYILFCRRPLSESSSAKQALSTHTGLLNIDACRTKGIVPKPPSVRAYRRFDNKYDGKTAHGVDYELVEAPDTHPNGRWPTNYLFQHGPKCKLLETVNYKDSAHDKYECYFPCQLPEIERQSIDFGVIGSKIEGGHADDGAGARFYSKFTDKTELMTWLRSLACSDGSIFDPFSMVF